MITKIFIPILIAIVLPDIYFYLRYIRKRKNKARRLAMLLLPSIMMAVATVGLVTSRNFAPKDMSVMNTYLLLLALLVVPKLVFFLSSLFGTLCSRIVRTLFKKARQHPARNYGNITGWIFVLLIWYISIYGSTAGFHQLNVRHVEYISASLPASFDGYKIVHFSDAHVGTYQSCTDILREYVDSINAQDADAVMFTGDLQNREPQELYPCIDILSTIKAKDGVYSVLGNHDYANYIHASPSTKIANERETVRLIRQMGWHLLVNDHVAVRRSSDSIVVAGMANDGDSIHFPRLGDIQKTLNGVNPEAFVTMLEHDPSSWRRKILPESHAQLTLSGHTHAMQFALFGWSPASLIYDEWGGMFFEGDRAINVSTGLGGFIPFRFGMPSEIVVITLRKKR